MKICQITHGRVNPDGENGITRTVYNSNKYLNLNGISSSIYSFNDATTKVEDFKRDEFTTVKLFPRAKIIGSNDFEKLILSDEFDFDVVNFHLMWMTDKNTILKALKKKKIPYIITVHGAYAPNLIDNLKKKIRHTYDLHQLLKQEEFLKFFQSTAFDEMLLKVANDDVISFRNNNQWLVHHPNEALIFKDLDNVWIELKTTYNGDFKNLVYGKLPKEEVILETLKMIQERLKTISWTIKTEAKR